MGAEKSKELEIKLRKLFKINEKFQGKKKRWQAKSDIGNVIRRRKGEPDKRIYRMPKKLWFRNLKQVASYAMHGDHEKVFEANFIGYLDKMIYSFFMSCELL